MPLHALADLSNLTAGRDLYVEDPDFGASTGAADNAAAFQAAIDAAQLTGTILRSRGGTFTIKSKVVFRGPCDLGNVTLSATGITGVAVECSTGSATNPTDRVIGLNATLPKVINASKSTTGWAQTGVSGSIGIRVVNLYSSFIEMPTIEGFETGLQLTAYSNGHYYNTYQVGRINNCKRGIQFVAGDGSGFVNSNRLFGGDIRFDSGEGTSVSGVRCILVDTASFDDNTFTGISIEGNAPEYHIEDSGLYNRYDNLRYEATTPKALLNNANSRALFVGGYKLENLVISGPGITSATVFSPRLMAFNESGGVQGFWRGTNRGSNAYPVFAAFDSNANPITASTATWVSALTGLGVEAKLYNDANSRIRLGADGKLRIGDGASAINSYPRLYAGSPTEWRFDSGDFRLFGQDYTTSRLRMGSAYEWVDTAGRHRIKASAPSSDTDGLPFGLVQGGATASRPAAPIVGQEYFDTTLVKPIWCSNATGPVWVDATGAAV